MSADPTAIADTFDVTCVSTSALQRPLGTVAVEYNATYGRREWVWVKNGEASSDFALGLGVMVKDGTASFTGVLSGANVEKCRMLGVAQWAVADGSYSWIGKKGFFEVQSDGSTTANTAQQGAASGQFTDGVVGTDELPVWATETESPAGAAGLFTALIDF